MTITKNSLLIIVLVIIVALYLYFGNGTMMDSGMNGKMNLNDWMGKNRYGWGPALITFGFGVLVGWLIFRRKT
jgi:hypothetical protein